MGQMDEASQILDYLYLGSEWNASDLHNLKQLGIGYILNITKEVGSLLPKLNTEEKYFCFNFPSPPIKNKH